MSRTQPGAVILDQLRDRIVNGLYFGNWQPGDRLPSIRDIADAEDVDRKTAAAAYHRLAEEGLVEHNAAAQSKTDLSSLSSMLAARWKGGVVSGSNSEAVNPGQIRSFRIVKLDPASKMLELELA